MKNSLLLFPLAGLTSLCLFWTGCNEESNPPARPGSQHSAGLTAAGDLYVFPAAALAGLPESRLIVLDDNGVRGITMPPDPILVKNTMMRFDRRENELCGVFRYVDDAELFYACRHFSSGTWSRLTPAGYTMIHGVWDRAGTRFFVIVTRFVYIPDAPWYYVMEIDVATRKVTNLVAVDAALAFGTPQFIVLTPEEDQLFVFTAPFRENTVELVLSDPYVLQLLDLAQGVIVNERRSPPFITSASFTGDGKTLLMYSLQDNTIYAYDRLKDSLYSHIEFEPSSNMLYNVSLVESGDGLLIVDQTETHTVVRALSENGSSWEETHFDFLAFGIQASGDGRLIFREFHLGPEDFKLNPLPDRQETFYTVDVHTMEEVSSKTIQLPGEAFWSTLFYVAPGS